MKNSGFKIGDKVKLKPQWRKTFPQTTEVGEVAGLDKNYILVTYDGCAYKEGFPYMPNEIEHAVKVGEQLQFKFMERN